MEKKLGVSSALEGSVRKSGKRMRVALQLVTLTSQEPTRSDTYDRRLYDLFVA